MATFSRRGSAWRVQVRRKGSPALTRTLARCDEAERWAAQIEGRIAAGAIVAVGGGAPGHTRRRARAIPRRGHPRDEGGEAGAEQDPGVAARAVGAPADRRDPLAGHRRVTQRPRRRRTGAQTLRRLREPTGLAQAPPTLDPGDAVRARNRRDRRLHRRRACGHWSCQPGRAPASSLRADSPSRRAPRRRRVTWPRL